MNKTLTPVSIKIILLCVLIFSISGSANANGALVSSAFMPLLTQINFNSYPPTAFGNQDVQPTMTIEDGGNTLRLKGNSWKKISLPYTVTPYTVLEFDFKSPAQGEVQGIGFDDNNGQQENRTFSLYGTQNWGLDAFRYSIYAPGWKHYRIPVGKYYTGLMRYIFFMNDDDVASPPMDESYFKNLSIYEGEVSLPLTVDFNQYALSPYYSPIGNNTPVISVEDNGNTLHLAGNGWTQISMPILVAQATVLEFDFKSNSQGEVHGLGFDTDQSSDSGNTFKLYGTQNYGITDFNDYTGSAPEWKHYIIPIGQYSYGQQLYLFFANDHDVASPTAESYFSNVQIYNLPPTPTPTNTAAFTPTATATFTPSRTPTSTSTSTLTATPTPNSHGSGTCWDSGPSWPDYTVYYDIETTGPRAIPSDWNASIEASARTWNDVVPSHFSFIRQNGSSNTIRYEVPLEADKLAGTNASPSTGPYTSAYTKINPNFVWDIFNPPSGAAYNVRNVMTHEFGHWLYLDDIIDSNCSDVTMYAWVVPNSQEVKKIDLEIFDIDGVNYQYP